MALNSLCVLKVPFNNN